MILSSPFELHSYRLPLRSALTTQSNTASFREGLLLSWHSPLGTVFGEIAPLPGLHRESLGDVKKWLALQSSVLVDQLMKMEETPKFGERFESLPPSIRFGLEMLWFQYKCLGKPLTELSPPPRFPICLNGLLTGTLEQLAAEIQRCQDVGYKTVKLKVGKATPREDIQRIYRVRTLWPEVNLRLDANQAWTLLQAVEILQTVEEVKIDYCEEPLREPTQLPELAKTIQVPLALDESLWQAPHLWPYLNSVIQAVVLKPGILGGWQETLRWVQRARGADVVPVLSSCFESGLGHLWIALLAACHVLEAPAVGLDTAFWLKEDLLRPSFVDLMDGDSLLLPEFWPSWENLNPDVLTLV